MPVRRLSLAASVAGRRPWFRGRWPAGATARSEVPG